MAFCLRSFLILITICYVGIQGKAFVKFCYFINWAHQRVSPYTRFDVDHIDPSLCTHLVYAFATIDVDSGRIVPSYQDEDSAVGQPSGRYQRFNDLKKTSSHLKTLLSIGGELAGNDRFVAITRDDTSLQTFAQTTVDFLRKRGFDGLDVDWEYPDATTKVRFSRLLKTLRTAFEEDQSEGERLLLTAALPAGKHRIQDGYDMAALDRYLDLASLMTYDYHGGWSSLTGFDSPLYSRASNPQFNHELSTEWTVNYFISRGLPPSKILVGLTAAGTHFRLQDLNLTGVGAPVVRSDRPRLSELWQLPDRYAYPEICRVLQTASSTRVFDGEQRVPYVYQDLQWFGYEDMQSVEDKADWMQKKGVAGAMFWTLDMDDFTGKVCDQGTYPLLRALSRRVDEATHLTTEVNPNIHYLTRKGDTNTSSSRRGSWIPCFLVLALGWFCR